MFKNFKGSRTVCSVENLILLQTENVALAWELCVFGLAVLKKDISAVPCRILESGLSRIAAPGSRRSGCAATAETSKIAPADKNYTIQGDVVQMMFWRFHPNSQKFAIGWKKEGRNGRGIISWLSLGVGRDANIFFPHTLKNLT